MGEGAASTVTITPVDETDPEALYCHYEGQHQLQPCFVELDLEDGELRASYNPEIGNAVPESVWHSRRLRWTIPCLTPKAANELLQELQPLAQQVLDGASVEWDGHNHVGLLRGTTVDAGERIGKRCDPYNTDPYAFDESQLVGEVDFEDWMQAGDEVLEVTADMTDEQLQVKANELIAEAQQATSEGHTVLLGVYEYLERLRDRARDG